MRMHALIFTLKSTSTDPATFTYVSPTPFDNGRLFRRPLVPGRHVYYEIETDAKLALATHSAHSFTDCLL